jgi:hypothetical protein
MKLHTSLLLAGSLLASNLASAEVLDLNFSDSSFRVNYAGPLSSFTRVATGQYDVGVLYKRKEDGGVRPEDLNAGVAHIGVLATGDAAAQGFKAAAGLGARLVGLRRDKENGGAVAIGGQFAARMPGFERLGLSGYGYFAPTVTTFGEFERYNEAAISLDFEVVKQAYGYVGYRYLGLPFDGVNGGSKAESAPHVGIRLQF